MKRIIALVLVATMSLGIASALADEGIDLITYMVRYYSRLAVMVNEFNIDVDLWVLDPSVSFPIMFDRVLVATDDNGIINSASISVDAELPKLISFLYGLRDSVTFDSVQLSYGSGWAETYQSDFQQLDAATMKKPFSFGAYEGYKEGDYYYFTLRK